MSLRFHQMHPLEFCEDEISCQGNFFFALENANLPPSPYLDALVSVLASICWHGSAKEFLSALPLGTPLGFEDLRDILARLGYDTEVLSAKEIGDLSTPAIHVTGETVTVLTPESDPPRSGVVILVFPKVDLASGAAQGSWLSWTVSGLWSQVSGAVIASFFINVVGLALPFFTRYVYDRAIPAHSSTGLLYLGGGVSIAVIFGMVFRLVRSRLLTYAGGRLAYLSGVESFGKILSLPTTILTKSSTDAHLLRLRDLERVREFVSGNFATTLLDAPFILLYLGAVGVMGGRLALVPLTALILYCMTIPFLSMLEDRAMRKAAKLNSERSAIQQDTIDKLRGLIGVGLEERWIDNYSRVMARSAVANRNYALISASFRILSRIMSSGTALATLAVAMWLVLEGSITPGAMIGSMMFIWRITGPTQTLGTAFSRYFQLRHSARQMDRLMELQGENLDASLVSPLQDLPPTVALNRVVFRHTSNGEPALAGVSIQIEEGEVIGVTGPNGAGKTTLLQTVAGLIQPQGGSVLIGGRDLRQFHPEDVRSWLGFLPENDIPFRGTLRSNLLIAKSDATEEELLHALEKAGAGSLVNTLPEGLDSFMYLDRGIRVGHDMQQAICIARALLKNPRILLLDEPIFHNPRYQENFYKLLDEFRGEKTVLISSHDRDVLARCDKVLLLDQGMPISFGKPTPPPAPKTTSATITTSQESN
ncbi:peptidase domain-containing ABC transporter [Pseudodesulfovibrio piezophilus]|uniref:Putative Xenobiotic-transporting ATPase n=1 Tax=Pseudodesulfovibrio piezophilus (strain DSM 21447 / JCM 15486 / C1TLV30) TaxID=1322246 RepID=M1WSI3_PSEP2|nr:ATP-binding cassette domain-containing protein [Pseudodesulfovibrio piezophilus]CCH48892.1 putative Xenobiotic-transporting ATPase [Pseudodesulfovibrio piezophilus C1TLV30]